MPNDNTDFSALHIRIDGITNPFKIHGVDLVADRLHVRPPVCSVTNLTACIAANPLRRGFPARLPNLLSGRASQYPTLHPTLSYPGAELNDNAAYVLVVAIRHQVARSSTSGSGGM